MWFVMKPLFLLITSLLFSSEVWASACCGGSLAAPSMILGDDAAQITASYSYAQVVAEVGTQNDWHKIENELATQTYRIDVAHIFADRWQAGLSLPLVKRNFAEDSSTGVGDVSTTIAYEYLPDWDYNPWRPKGLGYLQLTAPTGRSIHESQDVLQLDARGRGFWTLGAGTVLTKIIGKWDLFSNIEAHRSFEREHQGRTLNPGWGGSVGVGTGYNIKDYRVGASLAWNYEDPIESRGSTNSRGTLQRFATAALSASYVFPQEWSVSATYSDQTLFGSPVNTSLGRGVLLTAQKRWLR